MGCDIGKYEVMVVARWGNADFARPWRVDNPEQVPQLLGLLKGLAVGRRLRVAMEPSGTYGDALRQAKPGKVGYRWGCLEDSGEGVAGWATNPREEGHPHEQKQSIFSGGSQRCPGGEGNAGTGWAGGGGGL